MLQTDVCAACHDAPPRYGHVVAWQSTPMARGAAERLSDAPADRSTKDPACISCHTTAGFLHRLGDTLVDAPAALGLTCATCHDAHPSPAPAAPGLFRHVELLPKALAERASSLPDSVRACVACHTPPDAEPATSAKTRASTTFQPLGPSQAALTAGRGGLDPSTGESLGGPAPHWAIAGGCVGCHDQGPAELKRGRNHAFEASPNDCSCCHESKKIDGALHERARLLLERFGDQGVGWAREVALRAKGSDVKAKEKSPARAPAHARAVSTVSLEGPLDRGAYDALLVFEDDAAAAHNQPYSRALLDAAEKALDASKEHRAR
jgi:hypothetical protein